MNGVRFFYGRGARTALVPVGEQVQCFGYGRGTTSGAFGTPSGGARPSDGLDGIFYRSWGGVVNELRRR